MMMSLVHIHQSLVKCLVRLCSVWWTDGSIYLSFSIRPHRDFDSVAGLDEETQVRYLARRWEESGLKNVQLINYTVLVSSPGSSPNTITDLAKTQCFLPSGAICDSNTQIAINESFAFAAYSSVGILEVRKKRHSITYLLRKKSKVIAKSHSKAQMFNVKNVHYGLACSLYFTGPQSAANKRSLMDFSSTEYVLQLES